MHTNTYDPLLKIRLNTCWPSNSKRYSSCLTFWWHLWNWCNSNKIWPIAQKNLRSGGWDVTWQGCLKCKHPKLSQTNSSHCEHCLRPNSQRQWPPKLQISEPNLHTQLLQTLGRMKLQGVTTFMRIYVSWSLCFCWKNSIPEVHATCVMNLHICNTWRVLETATICIRSAWPSAKEPRGYYINISSRSQWLNDIMCKKNQCAHLTSFRWRGGNDMQRKDWQQAQILTNQSMSRSMEVWYKWTWTLVSWTFLNKGCTMTIFNILNAVYSWNCVAALCLYNFGLFQQKRAQLLQNTHTTTLHRGKQDGVAAQHCSGTG